MIKEQGGPSLLRFQLCHALDTSSVVPAPASTLIRGLYPKCVCFHPTKPLMAVGVSGYMAVYDMQSNTRLGRVDLKSVPVEMAFAPDGSVIIVVVQDWIIYSVSTSSWKARQVVPRRTKMDKPLENCLLAVAPGHNPFIYFCRYAKSAVRLATLPTRAGGVPADGAGAGGSAAATSGGRGGGGWGHRVKLDGQRSVLSLACHHVDAQLLVLTDDGKLRGYAIAGNGGELLTPLYAVKIQERAYTTYTEFTSLADMVPPTPGVMSCVPHPVPGAAIILQGSRSGTVCVLEALGRSAPVPLSQGRIPGHNSTVGMGMCRATGTVLAFGLNEYGRLRCTSWRLSYRQGATGVALRHTRVEPQDITPLLDTGRRTKAALANAMAAGALAAGNGYANTHGVAGRLTGAAGAAAGAAVAAASSVCHSLWGITPAWAHDAPSSCLMDSQLGSGVGRVMVHPSLGVVAVALDPPRAAQLNREVMFAGRGGLSVGEAAQARRTATLLLLMINNLEAHAGGWRGARTAPQHTGLATWMPQPAALAAADPADVDSAAAAAADPPAREGGDGVLMLPPHVYYLAGNRLMKYSLVTRLAGTVVQLPTDAPDGEPRAPRQLHHSSRRGAWLVFFESGLGGGTGGGAGSLERFTWTLVNAASFSVEGGAGMVSWIRPGKSGCFLGPDDAHFCVMAASGKLLEVYDTAATSGATAGSPLLTLTLEGGTLLQGLGSLVFAGPPMTNAPVPDAQAPPEAPPHDARRFRGSGVVLWQSGDMALNMTTLPALTRVPLDDTPPVPPTPAVPRPTDPVSASPYNGYSPDGDGYDTPPQEEDSPPDEEPQQHYPTMPHGHYFGQQPRQAYLPLMPHENVIHVAWQSLALAPRAADAADAVAAVLTSQRLLLVTAGLRIVCSASLATHGSSATLEPLSSVLWAGPMLLVSTAAGQVLQLTWTGSLLPVCSMSPTGHMMLLGVTADTMVALRTPLGMPPAVAAAAAASGNAAAAAALAEAVSRPAALLQPLLIGWASLAATGLLSYGPGAAVVRPALRHVLASYDAHSVTPRGVWALIAAGAWDVAAAVASHMPPLESSIKVAAAAAAGDWAEVQATLMAEASRALHAPAPPPRGSELHCKLVAAAAGALFHGQLTSAGTLFQAAGEWPAAMLMAMCQGNVQDVSAISHKLLQAGGPGAPPTPEAQLAGQLAAALRSVYGGVGNPVGDLTLTLAMPGHRPGAAVPLERAERWPLAAPLAAAAAVAVLGGLPPTIVPDSELGAIPPCPDRGSAVSYYGLTATAAASVAAASAAASARAAAADRGGAGAASVSGAESSSHRPGGSTAAGDLETTSVASSDAAQAAARAEFLNQAGAGAGGFGRGPTIDFSSDEDSGSEAAGSTADAMGGGGSSSSRIKIQIRDRGGAGGAAAAGPTGGDSALRDAAKGLRLAPPGAAAAASAGGIRLGLTPQASISSTTSAASAAPGVQFPPGMSSAQLYAGGVAMMEAGDWRVSSAHFSRAMSVLQHDERGAMDEQSRRSRLAFCAQYYAAVRLLEGVAGGTGPREARLYRYLAGLNLDPKHSTALLREAITRNRTVGNYRYAGDQLTALISRVADTAPAEYLAQVQVEIEECDRHGGRNAGLPADEQVADWALLVVSTGESGGSKEDVDALVLPLLV